MTRFEDKELTRNNFLGGRVRLLQPEAGYRAGVDPVFLAASVPARTGQSVLELGCGAGAAILCLSARVPGLKLTGVELQPAYADLARRNAEMNGVDLDLVEADLTALPTAIRQRQFDHVIANPPYYRAGAHSRANDTGRSIALGEDTPLQDWISVAAKRLAPQGYLHMIQKADRLPDMIVACTGRLGSVEVLPLSARTGREAELVILRARKGGRAAFRLHAPLILHKGERHEMDGESYTEQVSAVLRQAAPLPRF
ncbi:MULTISPECIES: tRNA1(Val) (adenine(37)-N6)-methyltransferase [unclassified Ruegeria]|uniref:tRNA1(Val) (adenine(37)-N6)-methyltransferase n=1 Tax=unclassified Ruegeria TaxID=2625375 RepID=UPI0014924EFD|nr:MULTISPECIES: methyltransferase [unclassified Ruegeria]NOD76529.1 methyltransferase [Ruegeria sp. HKCCD4332]NOD89249.1 methyltransferase [Ruegeria sp. HKCCD4318]NOE13588.1 methyltransferase [Ruegeria sp. HKCCD4318-2]NOG07661.1 methyltransferase [Ruegeria sp. HKCCD4315]